MSASQSNATKLQIADAAELLFSQHGFHGTSIREIFNVAKINQGLMVYYFRSKEDLYSFVVARRASQLEDLFLGDFPAAEDRGCPPPAHRYIEYYFRFFLINALTDRGRLSEYITLLAKSSIDYDNEDVRKSLHRFDFIAQTMVDALQRSVPSATHESIKSTVFYMEAAVTTMMVNRGLREDRLGGTIDSDRIELLIADMTEFFTRGFLRDRQNLIGP